MEKKHPSEFASPRPAFKRQVKLVKDIYCAKDKDYRHLFGIEWFVVLFLSAAQFLFPTLYIRNFLGKTLFKRKIWIERWALSKLFLLLVFLYYSKMQTFILYLTVYLLADLYLYLLGLVFLNNFYSKGISRNRNLILLQINFLESNLGFAILYLGNKVLFYSDKTLVLSRLESFYFSVVTASTVGFGDIVSSDKLLVTIQVLSSFLFISVILTTFLNKSEDQFKN